MFSGGFSRGSSRGFSIRSEDFPETLGSATVTERRKTWKKNKSKALEKNEENAEVAKSFFENSEHLFTFFCWTLAGQFCVELLQMTRR